MRTLVFSVIALDLYDGDWKDYSTGLFFGAKTAVREFEVSGQACKKFRVRLAILQFRCPRLRCFHPPTQETTALAVEECVTPDGDFLAYPYLASVDFAAGRMTRRSLGVCAPNLFSAYWRSRVWLLGTTGLPVGLLH